MKEAWQKFLHWKGWAACARGWRAFVRWKGWKAFVSWEGWRRFAGWKLWHPHPLIAVLLAVLSAGGLFWVFAGGREASPAAYLIYALSAYALTVLAVGIPALVRWVRRVILENKMVKPLVEDEKKRFLLNLFREQVVNLGYGIFKTVSGFLLSSAWVWADGLYNLVQGIMQLSLLTLHRRHLPPEKQWKYYRTAGWLVLVLHLTMTGLVFMMIHRGQAEEYPGFMIFATAAFTFYKMIDACVDVVKDRKHPSPVDSAVYLLDLTQAMFSMFSLQVAMLHMFDEGAVDVKLMNSLTGGAVCLLVMATGVYMIRRANREMKRGNEEK